LFSGNKNSVSNSSNAQIQKKIKILKHFDKDTFEDPTENTFTSQAEK
jgi:hypothetical protein